MKRIVLVCNAHSGIKEALERFRGRFLDESDYLFTFRDINLEYISEKIVSAYINAKPVNDYDTMAAVFFINGTEETLDDIRRKSPAVPFVKIPFRFERAHNREYLQLVSLIRRELGQIHRLVQALKKEFKLHDSRTPLLLPARNFKSSSLEALLIGVQKFRTSESDYEVPLRTFINSVGLQSIRESGKKTYFENKNSVRFYGPSKAGARHGTPFHSPPHNSACLVNAYFRLGARYDVHFHYDCQYEGRHIHGVFPNCHDGEDHLNSRTHINIAPNDFVR